MRKISTYLILLLTLVGCSHYVINENGYIRPPKGFKFSYRNKVTQLKNKSIIDTNAVYYIHNSNYYRNSDAYKNHDEYIRFYSNGRFKQQGLKAYPKTEDVNDINTGIAGYYYIKGNSIKMQVYSDINAGSDQLSVGIIDENKNLVILDENPRMFFCIGYTEKAIKRKIEKSNFNPKVYEKITIEGLTHTKPNW